MPTQEETKAAIKQLGELKPKVRHYSTFGDDNWAAIEAQIQVLEEDMDEDAIYDEWPEEEDTHERNAALDALAWLNDEELEAPLVEGWLSLVSE